ncbi:MAG: molybdenum cofactor synthesis protein [Marinilabiliales bacterium]|nr:MAG: molybdenum cofactor synthesis protein [Marinilabiliales bacterium]
MGEIKVVSVNISEEKGVIKKPVEEILLNEKGIEKDAHAGDWHRQVSLLAKESIEKFEEVLGRKLEYGEFAENITTEGITLYKAKPGDRIYIGDVELEVTQIGKKCHGDGCAIFSQVGKCVMPKEGIFAKVLKTGTVKAGDKIKYLPKVIKVFIVTLSDRASKGEYEDKSGPKIYEMISNYYKSLEMEHFIDHQIIPDDASKLDMILENAKEEMYDVVITTGGTGIGPRDITVETVQSKLDKEIPGIMEMIRIKYGQEKPNALLSRGVAGVMGNSLVYTLPGSVKAVQEYMTEILKTLQHLIYMLHEIDAH